MDTPRTRTGTGTGTAVGAERDTEPGAPAGATARAGRGRLAAGASAVALLALTGACAADPPGTRAALSAPAAAVGSRTAPAAATGGATGPTGADQGTATASATATATATGPEADGEIPDGRTLSPFDTASPAVGNLDAPLREALQRAATDARAQRIEMTVTSGWRSRAYQQRLLDRAVSRYGGLERARQFVNTPDRSAHVTGKAVDVGPTDADYWLIQHGAAYGLCQVYANEVWHFELLTRPGGTCPAQLQDAAG
ncbi:M15 family metallopeptidase [Kitasatospora sp. NPDC057692]|uniref:M15 family metallopeptidase n=1 Tax=Kitasatospora sp. NPDC057692 TaxID=3346215 RepID=UPI0036A896AA